MLVFTSWLLMTRLVADLLTLSCWLVNPNLNHESVRCPFTVRKLKEPQYVAVVPGSWRTKYKFQGNGRKSNRVEYSIVTGACWRQDTAEPVFAHCICVDLVQMLSPDEGCWVGISICSHSTISIQCWPGSLQHIHGRSVDKISTWIGAWWSSACLQ
jgi:hypothetical protein